MDQQYPDPRHSFQLIVAVFETPGPRLIRKPRSNMKLMIFLISRVVGHHLGWFSCNLGQLGRWVIKKKRDQALVTKLLQCCYQHSLWHSVQHNSTVSFIHSAVEKVFAKTGNSLNVVKNDGFTTLHIAAINDHREIANILLKKVIL